MNAVRVPVTSAVEPGPLIQVTKAGAVISGTDSELELLRPQFERQHGLQLPRFLDVPLLDLVGRKLSETEYRLIDRETGVELRPVDCTAYLATELLLNSPKLFRAVERLTGCARVACFSGRIYRRPPTSDYFNRWHTDIDEGRLIGLSINLSPERYSGGALQIRSSTTRELVCELHNPGYGDALLFPIHEKFEHRVCEVEGGAAKTALAGWFRSQFDPNSLFGRGQR